MSRWSSRLPMLVGAALALAYPCPASAQVVTFTVFSGSGATPADILPVVNQYRTALGGGTTAGANGSFSDATGARREINWDGVPASAAAPNSLPANFFNTTSPRGVVFSRQNTTGTGFMVSGAATDSGPGQPTLANFGNINPTYQAQFQPFSLPRLFTPLGDPQMNVSFFVPGTNNLATTRGFGAVFTDVDTPTAARLLLIGIAGQNLGSFAVPVSPSSGLSFLGVVANSGVPISAVGITSGTAALGPTTNDVSNGGTADLVVMDDFLYSEPIAVPEPTSLALLGLGAAGFAAWRRIRGQTLPAA